MRKRSPTNGRCVFFTSIRIDERKTVGMVLLMLWNENTTHNDKPYFLFRGSTPTIPAIKERERMQTCTYWVVEREYVWKYYRRRPSDLVISVIIAT